MLERYPKPEDWYTIRFSDEVHWGIGPQGKLYIIRKPGERYCSDCIQEQDNRDTEKDQKRLHSWAAVGWEFKSPLYFYNIASNQNGKMTQDAYINQILNPIVLPWLKRGDNFILEEDNDSGHGPGRSNPVRTWKNTYGLQTYFNCHDSPDLSVIENCWQPPKQYLKKFPHFDEQDTRELALEGWDLIQQQFINDRVRSMPERLQAVIDMEGRMTGY
jgi:hypothetical protein